MRGNRINFVNRVLGASSFPVVAKVIALQSIEVRITISGGHGDTTKVEADILSKAEQNRVSAIYFFLRTSVALTATPSTFPLQTLRVLVT